MTKKGAFFPTVYTLGPSGLGVIEIFTVMTLWVLWGQRFWATTYIKVGKLALFKQRNRGQNVSEPKFCIK